MNRFAMNLFMKMVRPFVESQRRLRIDRFRALNPLAQPGGNVLVGDSITEGFPIDELYTGGKRVYNRGISGDSTIDVLARLEESVFELSPARVFLQIGTNDLNLPKPATPAEIAARVDGICGRIAERLPATDVVLVSVYPVVETDGPGIEKGMVEPRTNADLREINRLLEGVAAKRGLRYVDLFDPLTGGDGQLGRAFTIEGLHLTVEGYKVVVSALEPLFV